MKKEIKISWDESKDPSHDEILRQIIRKLAKAKFAPQQEIEEVWCDLLMVKRILMVKRNA